MATANSKNTAKKKQRGKPFKANDPVTGEKDDRINREGAPERGSSLKEIYDYWDQFTAEEIVAMLPAGPLRQRYQQMQKGIKMKDLKALINNASVIYDPQPGLVREIHDRTDGKVPDKVQHEGTLKVENLQELLTKVYGNSNTG